MRIACGVEYDGSDFCGWQSQHGVRTVQECVETAISKVADHSVQVVCAGRTDTGVHAVGQVIHFDSQAIRSTRSWVLGTNVSLPRDIVLRWAKVIGPAFHARFSATARHYRYVILNRGVRPAVGRLTATWCHRLLDAERMRAAARHLVGTHDFSSYRALACQSRRPIRTVHKLAVTRQGERIVMDVMADGFLHHMVRNIAGVLMSIGVGDHDPVWAREVLEYRDRRLGGVTARPEGLCLVKVEYPSEFGLPDESST